MKFRYLVLLGMILTTFSIIVSSCTPDDSDLDIHCPDDSGCGSIEDPCIESFESNPDRLAWINNTIDASDPSYTPATLCLETSLDLGGKSITELPTDAFSYLYNLTELQLSNNTGLKELPDNIFSDLDSLLQLGLKNSGITDLRPAQFNGLNSLTKLGLKNNSSSPTIETGTFTSLNHLINLNLSGNGLTCNETNETDWGILPDDDSSLATESSECIWK